MKKYILISFLTFISLILIFSITFRVKIKNFINQKYEDFSKYYLYVDKKDLEIQVPVIMYHYIADYGTDVSKLNDGTIISADAFNKQMKYLYDNGYKSLTMEEFMCWKNLECQIDNKRFLITFDDGFTSTYNLAEPILKKYNFTAVQFVINELLNEKTPTFEEEHYAYMGYDYIKNYPRNIIEIGSHTYHMHHQLPEIYAKVNDMSYDEILKDFTSSKEELKTQYLSYPFGAVTKDAIKAAKEAGYECGFALKGTMTYAKEDNYQISRISATENYENFKEIFETNKYRKKSCKLF